MVPQDLMRGVWWLASLSVVTWVAPELRIVTSNAYASVVVQSGELMPARCATEIG